MGIDLCSEITIISPRISFSHDLDRPNEPNRRLDPPVLDSASDFDFCFAGAGPAQEPSPADELFSNGRILPIQIKKIQIPARQNRGSVPNSSLRRRPPPEKKMLKEFLSGGDDDDGGESETENKNPSPARAYWRSSSLNCDAGGGRGLIRSLHFLSRSNSTGSVPVRPALQKQPSVSSRKSSSSSSSSSSHAYYPYRPALSRCGVQGAAAVRTSPVLNLPPPYISRVTVNLFGFGSIFCNGKFKNKKKK